MANKVAEKKTCSHIYLGQDGVIVEFSDILVKSDWDDLLEAARRAAERAGAEVIDPWADVGSKLSLDQQV